MCFAVTVSVPKTPVSVSVLNRWVSSGFLRFLRFRTPVFCGSSLISRFSDDFSRCWFETVRFRHDFGLKIFEPEPNHGSKIDGFGSDKFSRFRFETVTSGYDFGFNRRFNKPWAGLVVISLKYAIYIIVSLLDFVSSFIQFCP